MARILGGALVILATACAGEPKDGTLGDRFPDPVCDPLPPVRPPNAVLRVHRTDGQSLTRTLDAALVADAACPRSPYYQPPSCVHLTDEAMDYVWRNLVVQSPHTIELVRHGECIHCGGLGFTIEWPTGRCDRGIGHAHDIAPASSPRFERVGELLEAAAAAGGVVATSPPR